MISRKLSALAVLALVACGAPSAPEDARRQKFGANIVNPSVPQPVASTISQAGGVFTLNPTFSSTTIYVDLNCTASTCQMVGITAPPTNGTKICIADTGTQSTQYFHLNGSASAANRLSLLDAATVTVGAGAGYACLIYDSTINTGSGAWAQEGYFPTDVTPSSWTITNGLTVSAGGAAITGAVGVTSGDVTLNTAGKAFILIQNSGTATTSKIQAFSGTPNGTVTSTNKGDLIVDTSTPTLWIATASSSTVWQRIPGTYLGRQKFTASGTYTPTSGTRSFRLRMVGAGGGGGGSAGVGGDVACGGGGASGTYLEIYVSCGGVCTGSTITPGVLGTCTGGAGCGGAAGNNAGIAGADSTAIINGVTYTAKGGGGGAGAAASAGAEYTNGGAGQGGSTAADLNVTGPGQQGTCSSTVIIPGYGGSNPFGAGGVAASGGIGTGGAGSTYGGGGAGGGSTSTSNAGGAGGNGVVFIDEFD